jgi:hypothetical protein
LCQAVAAGKSRFGLRGEPVMTMIQNGKTKRRWLLKIIPPEHLDLRALAKHTAERGLKKIPEFPRGLI